MLRFARWSSLRSRPPRYRQSTQNERAEVATGTWVIAFPADEALWIWESRHVRGTRTGPKGEYAFDDLPAHHNYLVIATADVEPGQWQDPSFLREASARATSVGLSDGESKTLSLKLATLVP